MENNRDLLNEVIDKTLLDLKTLSQGSKEYVEAVKALKELAAMQKAIGEVGVSAMEAETKRLVAETKKLEAENDQKRAEAEAVKAEAEQTKAKSTVMANVISVGRTLFMGAQAWAMFSKSLDFDRSGGFIDCKNAFYQAQRGVDRFFRDNSK